MRARHGSPVTRRPRRLVALVIALSVATSGCSAGHARGGMAAYGESDIELRPAPPAKDVPPSLTINEAALDAGYADWQTPSEQLTLELGPEDVLTVSSSDRPRIVLNNAGQPLEVRLLLHRGPVTEMTPGAMPTEYICGLSSFCALRPQGADLAIDFPVPNVPKYVIGVMVDYFADPAAGPQRVKNSIGWVIEVSRN